MENENYSILNKLNYELKGKRSTSPPLIREKYLNNIDMIHQNELNNSSNEIIYSQYQNYLNHLNLPNNNSNILYPNYYTNYNTSNSYHINTSQQNVYYGKTEQRYNRYGYPTNNNIQNNYYINNIGKNNMNQRILNESREKLKKIYNAIYMKKKRNKNCVNLEIANCETQSPIMTCFNADPYNKLKRKGFIQNYNYLISSNNKHNKRFNLSKEKKNSIHEKNLFNNNINKKSNSKKKVKNNKISNSVLNNSCYNFRKKERITNIGTIGKQITNKHKKMNTNDKNNMNINTNIIQANQNYSVNNKINKFHNYNNEKQDYIFKLEKFINYVEHYFIYSFYKIFHFFISQMHYYIEQRISKNKNLLLKRFQRARNIRTIENSVNNYSPGKSSQLDISFNELNKVYIPKNKYKFTKQANNKINNIKLDTNNYNIKPKAYLNTDYNTKNDIKSFKKKTIYKGNSVDKSKKVNKNIINKNKSQEYLVLTKYSPGISSDHRTMKNINKKENKFILKSNNSSYNNLLKNRIIYTKKRTNKFSISKKYITDKIINNYNNRFMNDNNYYFFNNNMYNIKNNDINNPQDKEFSFININGVRSPINIKYKFNERYNKENFENNIEYYDNEIKNEIENEDIMEQTIIKDICTYDRKLSVFIKYITSPKTEQNYQKWKLIKYKYSYLNKELNYIESTHTDSIELLGIYKSNFKKNPKFMMNAISEEKESIYYSSIQDDENLIKKFLNMLKILDSFYSQNIIYCFNTFFNYLKYISYYSKKSSSQRDKELNYNPKNKSKSFLNWKDKNFFLENDINIEKKLVNVDLINNIFKRSNSVKDNNKLYKKENDLKQIKNINYNELILLFRIKLLAFALQRRDIDKEAK